jgi:hypothetical protein
MQVARIDAELLEWYYARLHRCKFGWCADGASTLVAGRMYAILVFRPRHTNNGTTRCAGTAQEKSSREGNEPNMLRLR